MVKSGWRSTVSAIKFRDELLQKGWPDDHGVAKLAGDASGQEGTTYVLRAESSGDLLGVWSAPRHCFLYPDFQFNRSGAIRRDVGELPPSCPAKTIAEDGDGRFGCIRRTRRLMTGRRRRSLLTSQRG
jgi:hypothetical protein